MWLGDGWCDETNNTEECGWDVGDCCPGDCIGDGCDFISGCLDCLDPESNDNLPGGECDDGEYTCEELGDVTCWEESCA